MAKQVLWVVWGVTLACALNLLVFVFVRALGFFGPEVVALAVQKPFDGRAVVMASAMAVVVGACLVPAAQARKGVFAYGYGPGAV